MAARKRFAVVAAPLISFVPTLTSWKLARRGAFRRGHAVEGAGSELLLKVAGEMAQVLVHELFRCFNAGV